MRRKTALILGVAALLLLPALARAQEAGDEWTEPITGMEFVWVPGGCYEMGCGEWAGGDCEDDEYPVHEVCVDGFWMGKYEVTQGQWRSVMGDNPSHFSCGDNCPVEQVSWNDVQEFLSHLISMSEVSNSNYRLPTEAEWEYACRSGGLELRHAGANDVDVLAWHVGNSNGTTHPVGTMMPNETGLYDMNGNVWEWVQDGFNANAYEEPIRNNPIFDIDSSVHIKRGGSWYDDSFFSSCGYRSSTFADIRHDFTGFRLVKQDN